MTFFRRSGAQILRVLRSLTDPAASTGEVSLYQKDGQLFVRNGDGTIYQMTPVLTVTEIELDFGTTPVDSMSFLVVDAAVSATSKVTVSQSGAAATGREADEAEMDPIAASATPGVGQVTVMCAALKGRVVGKYKFNYQIGL